MKVREKIASVIRSLYARGLTTTSGGNVSVRDENGDVWITPSALDKGILRAEDIVKVNRDGLPEGTTKPSSELPFHLAVYRARPDINALIHAHPPGLVSCSIVRKIPETESYPLASYYCGKAGFAAYCLPGSSGLGETIAGEFSSGAQVVLMENHGAVAGGANLEEALLRFESFELCARISLNAAVIGHSFKLEQPDLELAFSRFNEHLESPSSTIENSNIPDQAVLSGFFDRAARQGLIESGSAVFSKRIGEDDFIITRRAGGQGGVVRILNKESAEQGQEGMLAHVHRELYMRLPKVSAIIQARPKYLMAFALTGIPMEVRTIPETWIFLRSVPTVPFQTLYKDVELLIKSFNDGAAAVIVQNDSIWVCGESMLQAFDRLEVAESSAKSLVLSRSLGEISPINDQQIEELRRNFPV